MNAYCPDCETELDQATGICPACRWDPMVAKTIAVPQEKEPEMSLTERYRGTTYDVAMEQLASYERASNSRGRAFILISLAVGVGLYALVISSLGMF